MKRKIALLLITGICLANTVPCFASPSMKVSVSSSEENQYPKKINIPRFLTGIPCKRMWDSGQRRLQAWLAVICLAAEILRNHLILIQMALLSTNRKV